MSANIGRKREERLITRANRAAAIGKLMLGQFQSWDEFWGAASPPLEHVSRRRLKGGKEDVRRRLSREITTFCQKNFEGMTVEKLELLFIDVEETLQQWHVASWPLVDFERSYGIPTARLEGQIPRHAFVNLSLWGLQYWFPEDKISKSLIEALNLLKEVEAQLVPLGQVAFSDLTDKRDKVATLIRKKEFALRSCLLDSFALMEAYLNGLAWDFLIEQGQRRFDDNDRQMLEDTGRVPFRRKILHYPRIVSEGRCILDARGEDVTFMLEVLKPTRDALTHPSPISPRAQPEFSKLLMARYIEQTSLGYDAVTCALNLMKSIEQHLGRTDWPSPRWLADLVSAHASIKRPIDALAQ